MNTASPLYKTAGLQRILTYKQAFQPASQPDQVSIDRFVNLFCEYQLADNNYMNLHLQPGFQHDDELWFGALHVDQVLQLITYIIWTDRFVPGYLLAKVNDKSLFRLLERLEQLQPAADGTAATG